MSVAVAANENVIDNAIYTWAGLSLANPDGAPVGNSSSGDRTVQVQGTWGVGGALTIQGTLDNQNWFTLRDPGNTNLTFPANGLKAVMENVVAVRPLVTGGDGTTSLTVLLSIRKRNG